MLKKISIVVTAAALVAAFIGTFTWPGEAQQRTASARQPGAVATEAPEFSRHHDAGMRIIHVPQPGAVVARHHEEPAVIDDDIEAPPTNKRTVAPQPRRVLAPADSNPKRTMLNAPKSIHDGPTPIRPLPRWRTIEKFTELPKRAASPPPAADPVTAAIPAQAETPAAATPPVSDPDTPAIDDDAPPPAELPPTQ